MGFKQEVISESETAMSSRSWTEIRKSKFFLKFLIEKLEIFEIWIISFQDVFINFRFWPVMKLGINQKFDIEKILKLRKNFTFVKTSLQYTLYWIAFWCCSRLLIFVLDRRNWIFSKSRQTGSVFHNGFKISNPKLSVAY